jgi:neutral trehalase
MWKGPVWLNFNYMIAKGLECYGYTDESREIKKATLSGVLKWYLNDGVLYEYYDPNNNLSPARLERKASNVSPYMPMIKMQSIRDFGWSVCLTAAMLMEQ